MSTIIATAQEYIDELKVDLDNAKNECSLYAEKATKAKAEYQIAKKWKEELEGYKKRIEDTYDLGIDLDVYLASLIEYSDQVFSNIKLSGETSEILTKCTKCILEEVENLKGLLKNLLEAIDKLNDPTLNPEVSIMKCLHDLESKVKAAIEKGLESIKKLLKLQQHLLKIKYLLCTIPDTKEKVKDTDADGIVDSPEKNAEEQQDKDDSSDSKDKSNDTEDESKLPIHGLKYDLGVLREILCCFYCGGFRIPESHNNTSVVDSEIEECCGSMPPKPDCIVKLEKGEAVLGKPKWCGTPENPDGSAGYKSTFYKNLELEYNKAEKMATFKRCAWATYDEFRRKKQANKDAIQAALDAANAAKERCN